MSTTDRTPSVPSVPSTPALPDHVAPDGLRDRAVATLSRGVGVAARGGRALGFWLAALLPLTYLPLLAAGGASDRPALLAGLLAAHAGALVLGRGHNADADDGSGSADSDAPSPTGGDAR
ncbi:hypothetical protein Hbl1158_03095 [Halobaculum sp. CBA1158]|uniref:hypothetical protein n=1 Tax=Halobaculum sp. CBA1158 TaxID=2904243 RepID=UPI001F43E240|nr:hypothetical protein [Halobaculum sp. CBA1158]UIP00372.1 hypothetical protein Hbl1158_03095 [Halobaculum sp. CBA1158]